MDRKAFEAECYLRIVADQVAKHVTGCGGPRKQFVSKHRGHCRSPVRLIVERVR